MQKRLAVALILNMGLCGKAHACRLMGLPPSTAYYRAKLVAEDAAQEGLVVEVSREHPCLGYRKVTAMLRENHQETINPPTTSKHSCTTVRPSKFGYLGSCMNVDAAGNLRIGTQLGKRGVCSSDLPACGSSAALEGMFPPNGLLPKHRRRRDIGSPKVHANRRIKTRPV